jgi:hypothetical protein
MLHAFYRTTHQRLKTVTSRLNSRHDAINNNNDDNNDNKRNGDGDADVGHGNQYDDNSLVVAGSISMKSSTIHVLSLHEPLIDPSLPQV